MATEIRRVVTGHDAGGKAVVVMDGPAPNVLMRKVGGMASTQLWRTFETPADNEGADDAVVGPILTPPPERGSVFRITEIPPVTPEVEALGHSAVAAELGAKPVGDVKNRHPFMHRTDSVDYALILEGEIDMLLDDSEVHLKAGDVVIQRGTNHAWVNRGTRVCRIAFILIDAKPVPGAI